jgi:lysozyme
VVRPISRPLPLTLKGSTMLKKITPGWSAAVPARMKRWTRAGGKVVEGLERRREADASRDDLRWC